jgi:hypothetical protein
MNPKHIFIGLIILALLLVLIIFNMNKDIKVVSIKQGRMSRFGDYFDSETDNFDPEI